MAEIIELGIKFLYYFFGILIITNPLSTAIIFLTLTEDATENERKATARGATTISTILLLIFAIGGIYIFYFFGISVGAFQITGGIILITIGLKLLKGEGKKVHSSHFEADDIMVVPLAIPMLAGAGAITTVVVYMSEGPTFLEIGVLLLAILINGLLAFIILRYSVLIKKVFFIQQSLLKTEMKKC